MWDISAISSLHIKFVWTWWLAAVWDGWWTTVTPHIRMQLIAAAAMGEKIHKLPFEIIKASSSHLFFVLFLYVVWFGLLLFLLVYFNFANSIRPPQPTTAAAAAIHSAILFVYLDLLHDFSLSYSCMQCAEFQLLNRFFLGSFDYRCQRMFTTQQRTKATDVFSSLLINAAKVCIN